MKGCNQELCPNWSGDGRVCPCAISGMESGGDCTRPGWCVCEPFAPGSCRWRTDQPRDQLSNLYDAALPDDAPGAWIRQAIERMRTDAEA